MKRHFLHLMTTLLAGASLALSSCSDSDTDGKKPVEPNFPQPVTPTVAAGSSYEIQIEPNLDWEVSIPTSSAPWFWIQDGTQTAYKVRGTAGTPATIKIGVSDLEEFDETRTCEVSMTMGQQTKVIATITRGTVNRTMALYTCKMEDGDFSYNPDTDASPLTYVYNEEPAKTIDLIWPEGRTGFMYPIMIEANFDWRLAEKPEWVAAMKISSGKAGQQIEIRLDGDATKYPLDGDKGKLILCDESNPEATYEFEVTIPACRDIFEVSGINAESKFNAKAEYFNALNGDYVPGAALGNILSIKGSKVYIFSENKQMGGDVYLSPEEEDTKWIIVTEDPWDETVEGGVVQSRKFTIGVTENDGADRKGIVIVLPASVAETITDPYQLVTDNSVNGNYIKYIVTTIEQATAPGSIAPVTPENMAGVGAKFEKLIGDWTLNQFKATEAFQLTYTKDWSRDESALTSENAITSYKFYDFNLNEMSEDDSWLSVMEFSGKIIIDMDPRMDPTAASSEADEGIAHKGFIVMTGADGYSAVITCVYDERIIIDGGDSDEGFKAEFAYPDYVNGAELTAITTDNYQDVARNLASKFETEETKIEALAKQFMGEYNEWLAQSKTIYLLTYTKAQPMDAALKVSSYSSIMVMPYSGVDWLNYEPQGENELLIMMDKPTGDQPKTCMVQFYDGMDIKGVVYCAPLF